METRGVRDQIVLATKYTSPYRTHNKSEIQANFVGNNAKSLKLSVEASLKKLRTEYIDLVRGCSLLSVYLLLEAILTNNFRIYSSTSTGGISALPSRRS